MSGVVSWLGNICKILIFVGILGSACKAHCSYMILAQLKAANRTELYFVQLFFLHIHRKGMLKRNLFHHIHTL